MTNITLLAIDLAKNVFQLHGVDETGRCVFKKRVKRDKLLHTVHECAPKIIAMEACGSAHYWARTFQKYLNCEIRLVSPQFVKPFVKSNKNDKNDALAIAEAAMRPSMNFVSVKSEKQQVVQAIHRHRSLLIKNRTALSNHARGLLAEFGFDIPQKMTSLKNKLVDLMDEQMHPDLPALLREMSQDWHEQLLQLDKRIKTYDNKLNAIAKQEASCALLLKQPGIGICSATMAWVSLGENPMVYRNGRQYSASIGLVPRQHSSGNKHCLGKISKRGDSYFRQLIIHGARSVVWRAMKKNTPENQWINDLLQRRGFNVTVVAVANKNARKIWRTLAEHYQASNDQQKKVA